MMKSEEKISHKKAQKTQKNLATEGTEDTEKKR